MADITSLTFDVNDCELQQQSENHRAWMTSNRVAVLLRYYPQPPGWSFDLTDLQAASDFYARQCTQNAGAMLSLEHGVRLNLVADRYPKGIAEH